VTEVRAVRRSQSWAPALDGDVLLLVTPTLRISDPEQKHVAREALAAHELATWGSQVERQLGDGPFVGGQSLHVSDIKLYMVVRWLTPGTLDHVPATVL
jgi:prostaglandin-H2 D-isomerase / glutathione transferase